MNLYLFRRRSTTVSRRGMRLLLASQWNCFCEISCSLFSTNCSCSGGPRCVCCLSERWKGKGSETVQEGGTISRGSVDLWLLRTPWMKTLGKPINTHGQPCAPSPIPYLPLVQLSRLSIFNANIQIHHRTGWRENKNLRRFERRKANTLEIVWYCIISCF